MWNIVIVVPSNDNGKTNWYRKELGGNMDVPSELLDISFFCGVTGSNEIFACDGESKVNATRYFWRSHPVNYPNANLCWEILRECHYLTSEFDIAIEWNEIKGSKDDTCVWQDLRKENKFHCYFNIDKKTFIWYLHVDKHPSLMEASI